MKIAVLYTGELRTIQKTIHRMKERFFDINDCYIFAGLQASAYGQDLNKDEYSSFLYQNFGNQLKSLRWLEKNEDLYNQIRDQKVNDLSKYLTSHTINYLFYNSGSLIEYYQLWVAYEEMCKYEKENEITFDYIFRTRADMMIYEKLEVNKIINISREEVQRKIEKFINHSDTREKLLSQIMTSLWHPKLEDYLIKSPGTYYENSGEKQILDTSNEIIKQIYYCDDNSKLVDLIYAYIQDQKYILVLRKNVNYITHRNNFNIISQLFYTYGDFDINKGSWWWNSESQFRSACCSSNISVFDYENINGEVSIDNYDPENEGNTTEILYGCIRS